MKKILLLLKTVLALPMRNKAVQQNYFEKPKLKLYFLKHRNPPSMNKIKRLTDFNTPAK